MDDDKCREESEHDEDRESYELILPCENPSTIECTRDYIQVTNVFLDEFIFLSLPTEIIHERENRKNQK